MATPSARLLRNFMKVAAGTSLSTGYGPPRYTIRRWEAKCRGMWGRLL